MCSFIINPPPQGGGELPAPHGARVVPFGNYFIIKLVGLSMKERLIYTIYWFSLKKEKLFRGPPPHKKGGGTTV